MDIFKDITSVVAEAVCGVPVIVIALPPSEGTVPAAIVGWECHGGVRTERGVHMAVFPPNQDGYLTDGDYGPKTTADLFDRVTERAGQHIPACPDWASEPPFLDPAVA